MHYMVWHAEPKHKTMPYEVQGSHSDFDRNKVTNLSYVAVLLVYSIIMTMVRGGSKQQQLAPAIGSKIALKNETSRCGSVAPRIASFPPAIRRHRPEWDEISLG